jgi:hypothetical protein
MKQKSSSVVWSLFGCVAIASLSTIMVPQPEPSGGFTNQNREYFAPINSKTIGACVNIKETRPYIYAD